MGTNEDEERKNADKLKATRQPKPVQPEPRGKYDQTHEPTGVRYDKNGAQIGPYTARPENRKKVLPRRDTYDTNSWDPTDADP